MIPICRQDLYVLFLKESNKKQFYTVFNESKKMSDDEAAEQHLTTLLHFKEDPEIIITKLDFKIDYFYAEKYGETYNFVCSEYTEVL